MSRSVSAPSSVTNTSPCWNGFIVPGSTLRYGSSFCMVTRRPRDLSSRPRLEAVRPLPSDDATPPVTKTCLVTALPAKVTPVGECRRIDGPMNHSMLHGTPAYQQHCRQRGTAPSALRAVPQLPD